MGGTSICRCREYLHQVLMGGGGYPHSSQQGSLSPSFLIGVPSSFFTGGYPILPDRRVPHSSRWGYPPPHWDWMGYPYWDTMGLYPPVGTGWGTSGSPSRLGRETEQLRDGRYASCVNAGGLSCLSFFV